MAARLPNPGGDAGNWGKILNEYLRVEHNDDGTLKDVARQADLNFKANVSDLGTAATQNADAFATAEQGEKADTAIQPEAITDFETSSQLEARDSLNRDRNNHTGTQLAETISDFDAATNARVAAARQQSFPKVMNTPPAVAVGSANASHSISPGNTVLVFPDWHTQVVNPVFTITGTPSAPPFNAADWFTTINTIQTGRLPARLEFMHDGAVLEIQMRGGGNRSAYRIIVDGEYVSPDFSPDFPGDLASYWVLIDFGGRDVRHVVIEFDCQSQFRAIRHEIIGGIYRVPESGPRVIALGDSWTQGANSVGGRWRDGFVYQAGYLLGWSDVWASGIGGTGYLRSAGMATYGERLQNDCLQWNPDIVIVSGGTNDFNEQNAASRIHDAARSLFESIKSAPSSPSLVVIRPFSGYEPGSTALDIDAGVAAAANGVADVILDPLGERWLTGSGSVGAPANDGNRDVYIVDGHPTREGHRYLGRRIATNLTGKTL